MTRDVQHVVLDNVVQLLAPVGAAVDSPDSLQQLLARTGWDLSALTGVPLDTLRPALQQSWQVAQDIEALLQQDARDLGGLSNALADIAQASSALASVARTWRPATQTGLPA